MEDNSTKIRSDLGFYVPSSIYFWLATKKILNYQAQRCPERSALFGTMREQLRAPLEPTDNNGRMLPISLREGGLNWAPLIQRDAGFTYFPAGWQQH